MTTEIQLADLADQRVVRECMVRASHWHSVIIQDQGEDVAVILPIKAFRAVQEAIKGFMEFPLRSFDGSLKKAYAANLPDQIGTAPVSVASLGLAPVSFVAPPSSAGAGSTTAIG